MTIQAVAAEASVGSVGELARTIDHAVAHGLIPVGLVGRAALLDQLTGDPLIEVRARGQHPLVSTHPVWQNGRFVWEAPCPRDVDTIGGALRQQPGRPLLHPIHDTAFYNTGYRLHRNDDGTWLAVFMPEDGRAPLVRKLPASMFTVDMGRTLFGLECPVLPAATHYALLENVPKPQKSVLAQEILRVHMPADQLALLETEPYQDLIMTRTAT